MEKNEKGIQQNINEKSLPSLRKKFPIQSLLVESFSIVIGVLLALGVNQWREDRSNQSRADSAIQNILNEVKSNEKMLKKIHENNSVTINSMSNEAVADSTDDRTFIPGILLQDTAFETFISTGISSYTEYETVLLLSKSYSLQNVYKQTGTILTESTMNMSAYAAVAGRDVDNRQFQRQFYDYFTMIVSIEEELLKSYEEIKEHLKSKI